MGLKVGSVILKADKRYQLADWRQRPLSSEMKLYARMDTHFLLYIYDNLRVSTIPVISALITDRLGFFGQEMQ